ncbi:MAG: ALG6, ALG8 glycosyltransferase family-domain-containing protein [Monoraphidium minutum]|nr:MAG: ALG6, ALG8 glycosyltransferase family-domain-containing protein [Monoraphidium minutum]
MAPAGGGAAGHASPGAVALLCACALLLRLLVGLSSYSGAATPPKFGDFEAQRHWMEITLHTPPSSWYTDGPHNNGSYWPLDYPPLSAYQSWLHGKMVAAAEPAAVALGTSAGYETPSSKALLRWTVVLSDAATFFPAAVAAARLLRPPAGAGAGGAPPAGGAARELFVLAALLLQPAHVLVDHGHFQYNCISLGLALGAAVAIAARRRGVAGSALFCAALSHKQMSLFYAPAFFAHLLGRCLERPGAARKVAAVAVLGVTVIAGFAVMWAPYLTSPDSLLQVAGRIFPSHRGLYEDYLANWWCATSVAVKWKALAGNAALVRACMGLTLLAAGPSMAQQVAAPSAQGLLLGMANSAFAFYMFGYQVHEKSILLPLMPITALAAWEPAAALVAPAAAAFSMYPLLERDGLALPYAATIAVYLSVMLKLRAAAFGPGGGKGGAARGQAGGWAAAAAWGGAGAALALHAARALLPPPVRLPWLHDRAFVSLAFACVAGGMAYFNWRQWAQPCGGALLGGDGGGGGGGGGGAAVAAGGAARGTPARATPARKALARGAKAKGA